MRWALDRKDTDRTDTTYMSSDEVTSGPGSPMKESIKRKGDILRSKPHPPKLGESLPVDSLDIAHIRQSKTKSAVPVEVSVDESVESEQQALEEPARRSSERKSSVTFGRCEVHLLESVNLTDSEDDGSVLTTELFDETSLDPV